MAEKGAWYRKCFRIWADVTAFIIILPILRCDPYCGNIFGYTANLISGTGLGYLHEVLTTICRRTEEENMAMGGECEMRTVPKA